MGATFGVAARALLTGAVFALEVTGAYHLVVPMLIALGIAELVVEPFLAERLMTDKLVRRGFRVEFDTETDVLRTSVAGQAMDPLPAGPLDPGLPRVDRLAYLRDAAPLFLAGAEQAVVCDGDRPVGMVTRATLDEALARRLAESVPQPTGWFRSRRVPRMDEAHHNEVPAEREPEDDRV